MQSYLFLGPAPIDSSVGSIPHASSILFSNTQILFNCRRSSTNSRLLSSSATAKQNHYAVLGVSPDASSSDIKKAFRLLARKYHPDVSKDSRTGEDFKKIRCAYEVLSNATTRNQYDRSIQSKTNARRPRMYDMDYDIEIEIEFEDGERKYNRWADLRQRMRHEQSWKGYNAREDSSFSSSSSSSSYYKTYKDSGEETQDEGKGSFIEVLKSAVLSIFLMKTIGPRLSLTFSSIMALVDQKLDAGYKVGYMIAWVLGGEVGILLALCLSCAIWICGKTSSFEVTRFLAALWWVSYLARLAIYPQGVLVTLLYMTIKLHSDLK